VPRNELTHPTRLPPAVHSGVIEAFARSLHPIFLWAIPFTVAGFLIVLFLREIPLREHSYAQRALAPVGRKRMPVDDARARQLQHPSGSAKP